MIVLDSNCRHNTTTRNIANCRFGNGCAPSITSIVYQGTIQQQEILNRIANCMNGLAPFITPIVYQRLAPVYQTLLVGLVGLLGGDSNGPFLGATSNATGYEFVDINDQRPTQQANHKMQELFTRITSAIAKNVRVSLTPRGGGIERIEVLGIDQGGFHQDPNGRVTVSLTSI